MPEQLLKNFSIDIQQKLYEEDSPDGKLAVYQTVPFGMMITINGQIVVAEHDGFFYHEMLVHPALFTHPRPKKIAIIGYGFGIIEEILKHSSITDVFCISNNKHLDEAILQYFSLPKKHDQRIHYHSGETREWLKQQTGSLDIIIQSQHSSEVLQENYKNYHTALASDGILIQPCSASLLHLKTLKPIFQNIQQAGFHDWQSLNFPQPSYPLGWRTVMMSTKCPTFHRVREKDIYNRTFTTRYYNYDTHKAALALPEFMRDEIEI